MPRKMKRIFASTDGDRTFRPRNKKPTIYAVTDATRAHETKAAAWNSYCALTHDANTRNGESDAQYHSWRARIAAQVWAAGVADEVTF